MKCLQIIAVAALTLAANYCLRADCGNLDPRCSDTGIVYALFPFPCKPELIAGSLQGCRLELDNQVTSIAGDGTAAYQDGFGTAAKLNTPRSVTTDGRYVYIADEVNDVIRKLDPLTGELGTLAGTGSPGYLDGPGLSAQFDGPFGITTDGNFLYIADEINNRIRKISILSGEVSTIAGNATAATTDGNGTSASFNSPQAIVYYEGSLYISGDSNFLRRMDLSTGQVTTIGGTGTGSTIDGPLSAATFNRPRNMTVLNGDLYIAETYGHVVRKVDLDSGNVSVFAGSAGTSGNQDGAFLDALLFYPTGITTDGFDLYVTDYGNSLLKKMDLETGMITTIAGDGSGVTSDGNGTSAGLRNPTGITTDSEALFFGQANDHYLRKVE